MQSIAQRLAINHKRKGKRLPRPNPTLLAAALAPAAAFPCPCCPLAAAGSGSAEFCVHLSQLRRNSFVGQALRLALPPGDLRVQGSERD